MQQQQELYNACRTGDLDRIRYLLAETDVDLNKAINGRTPLHIAFSFERFGVMQLLLENGAIESDFHHLNGTDSFQEDFRADVSFLRINSLLQPLMSDPFSELLKRIFNVPEYADVEFIIKKEKLRAHKLILAIQSPYFKELFNKNWKNKSTIDLTFMNISMEILKKFISYFYGERLTVHSCDMWEFVRIVKCFNITSLLTEIRKAMLVNKRSLNYHFTNKRLSREVLLKLFLSTVPRQFEPKRKIKTTCFPDVHFIVGRFRFLCHKVLVCERSNYLKALCADHFSEFHYCPRYGVQVVTLHEVDPVPFVKVLQYIYTDSCDLSSTNALDVLCLADMFMLSGLKRLCSFKIMENITTDNVIRAYRCSVLFDMQLLEYQSTKYMLYHFDELMNLPDFKRFVQQNSEENKDQNAIPVLDSIRIHAFGEGTEIWYLRCHQINQVIKDWNL